MAPRDGVGRQIRRLDSGTVATGSSRPRRFIAEPMTRCPAGPCAAPLISKVGLPDDRVGATATKGVPRSAASASFAQEPVSAFAQRSPAPTDGCSHFAVSARRAPASFRRAGDHSRHDAIQRHRSSSGGIAIKKRPSMHPSFLFVDHAAPAEYLA